MQAGHQEVAFFSTDTADIRQDAQNF